MVKLMPEISLKEDPQRYHARSNVRDELNLQRFQLNRKRRLRLAEMN